VGEKQIKKKNVPAFVREEGFNKLSVIFLLLVTPPANGGIRRRGYSACKQNTHSPHSCRSLGKLHATTASAIILRIQPT
jgi:hypothetical protein